MRVEYEYAETKMALELKQTKGFYVLSHMQYVGDPDSSLTKLFSTVKYSAKLNKSELVVLNSALSARSHEKIKIAKSMYVLRSEGSHSMLRLKFPQSLESVPLPRDASDSFIGVVNNVVKS